MKPLTERQRFERWAKRNGFQHLLDRYLGLRGEPYRCPETYSAWKGWQAALRMRVRGEA